MSYSEFLNRKKLNDPKVIAANMSFGDASSYTWRLKMASASVYQPTEHVITNVNDPNIVPDRFSKKPRSYAGNGYGGKVLDASDYTLSSAARSLKKDTFSTTKIVLGGSGTCVAFPPASQIVSEHGNSDDSQAGLNIGYIASCPAGYYTHGVPLSVPTFRPQTKSYFVDTIPDIQNNKVGIQGREAFSGSRNTQYGSQNTLNCKTTSTSGVAKGQIKAEVSHSFHSLGPIKTDFLTAPTGPQGSANGSRGRAPKVGAAIANDKYVEKHHGNPRPRAWGPRASLLGRAPQPAAPAQLKINSPAHYPVA